MFPGALQIVDLFHAKEHLWEVSNALHGSGGPLTEQWAQARCDELDGGRLEDLLRALRVHAADCNEVRLCAEYVLRNRRRMNYASFRSQCLYVGSSVVEATCKVTVGSRLKRAGMHWSIDGASAILALRCCKISGGYEDFWERRSQETC